MEAVPNQLRGVISIVFHWLHVVLFNPLVKIFIELPKMNCLHLLPDAVAITIKVKALPIEGQLAKLPDISEFPA